MYCHLHKNQGPKKVEVWKLETDDKGDKNQDSAKADIVSTTAPYQSAVDSDLLTKPIHPPVFNVNTAVPNAASVEKVCYAKLTRRNTRISCSGCLKLHIEWFQVPPFEVIAVIEKWSKWMRPHPCQPNPADPSNIWTVRPEEEQKSKDIGRFMKGIAQLLSDRQRLENLGTAEQKGCSIAHEQ
ncbi:hypothetical protein RU639_008053 [Aspergillus parasiticus]